jgi:hypothetical protein
MRYETRLERLEQAVRSPEPLRIVRCIVAPNDGVVAMLDRQTGNMIRRGAEESEADFKARVRQAVEAMQSAAREAGTA